MLKPGIYLAENDESIWDSYKITMEVKETEKSYIFRLVEFKSRYSGAHIEMLFKNSKRVVIRKDWAGTAFAFGATAISCFTRTKRAYPTGSKG